MILDQFGRSVESEPKQKFFGFPVRERKPYQTPDAGSCDAVGYMTVWTDVYMPWEECKTEGPK